MKGTLDLSLDRGRRSLDTPRNTTIIAAGIVTAVALTLIDMSYLFHMAVLITIFGGVAVSLDVLSGYTGQVSIAHAGFMGIGGYTSALLAVDFGVPIWAGILAGGLLTTIVGVALGYPSFRTTGHYFVLITIAIAILVVTVLNIWEPVTGGPNGVLGIPAPGELTFGDTVLLDLGSTRGYLYLTMGYLVATMCLANNILDSRIGRTFVAVRDNQSLAKSHGIHAKRAKLTALGVSCFFTGVGGAFYAHYLSFINPEMFSFFVGFKVLVMLIIGGLGSLVGGVVGAVIITLVPELLRDFPNVSELVFGLVLLAVVLFFPRGLWGIIRTVWNRVPRLAEEEEHKVN